MLVYNFIELQKCVQSILILLVVNFFKFLSNYFFCIDVAMCYPVHNVETVVSQC